ncbi:MAG: hypothetical protein JWQ30_1377 [Sediminibacterium sp.]|nr:hypothetical protein [Sediminibacterium sp.]
MDAKITLSFDAEIIEQAKKFAESNNISLSRLTEFLYRNITQKKYRSIEELPMADWISAVAEGQAVYITKHKTRAQQKDAFYKPKKK